MRLSPDRLKAVIAAAPRPELEQATLRLAIGALVLAFVAWGVLRGGGTGRKEENEVLAVAAGFVAYSVLLTLTILAAPHASAPRGLLGLAVDNAVTTYCLLRIGERGAFVFFVYLFVSFGVGFRYSRLYLYASQLISIVGFATVFWFSPFWREHLSISFAFLISLLVLPFYVGFLAERIRAERVKAEEALKKCIERERFKS